MYPHISYEALLSIETCAKTQRQRVSSWMGVEEEGLCELVAPSVSQYCPVYGPWQWSGEIGGESEDEPGGQRRAGS